MTSLLDFIETQLVNIDNLSDAQNRLQGVSFEKSYNESLGLSGSPSDFTVSMPWTDWKHVGLEHTKFPAPLQQAIQAVLEHGRSNNKTTKTPFVDFASLKPEHELMIESGKDEHNNKLPSVAEAIAAFVDSYGSDATPIIRFTIGDDDAKDRAQGWKQEDVFTDAFWPKDELGHRHNLVKHPKARIYVGYYNPNFHPKASTSGGAGPDPHNSSKTASDIIKTFKTMMSDASSLNETVAKMIKESKVEEGIDSLVTDGLRAVTWNHGKILAVNGNVVMTGGGNLFNAYGANEIGTFKDEHNNETKRKIDHNIFDHQAKVSGDAAVSAHRWADYFWKYLDKKIETDDNSTWWGANMSDPTPHWYQGHDNETDHTANPARPSVKTDNKDSWLPAEVLKAPFLPRFANDKTKIPVLTVGKLGDWHGQKNEITYPAMVFDLARDLIMNQIWQSFATTNDDPHQGLGAIIFWSNLFTSDLSMAMNMKKYNVNPTAWASRNARSLAIFLAEHTVHICQQMLVQSLSALDVDFQKKVKDMNTEKKWGDQQKWDGFIWAFDLMVALSQALGNISKSNQTDKGVYIVISTKERVDRQEWSDDTSIARIKHRIRRIMHGIPTSFGGIPTDQIDQTVNKHLHIKRVLDDKGQFFSHSKVVVVDKKLMYVGSDNAYPAYNEEHGIWIEHKPTIEAWCKDFFDPYWGKCTEPTDAEETKFFEELGKKADNKLIRTNN